MIAVNISNFLKGYLTIHVEGLNLEKFLNMSVVHGISFWDVRRLSMTKIQLRLTIRDYRLLKRILKKTGCQLSIVNKDGLPFFISKVKRRKMMALGFMVFILLIIMLSSFVWSIKVTGARTISTREVETQLAELGLKPGALKLNLAVSEIENEMLIRMKNISWIKVKLTGTRAEVEVKERTTPPPIVSQDRPCNIVASRDGIILKIVSRKGDVIVTEDETVKKGQVLVTGVIQRENAETRYVHSMAEILARTWYEAKTVVPLEKNIKVRNGEKRSKIFIIVGTTKLKIKNDNIQFKSYDKIERSTRLIESERFQLPIQIVIEEYYETENNTVIITSEEAKAQAADEVEKVIIDNMPSDAKIISKKVNITVKDNVVVASALVETLEDIGVQDEITINEEIKVDEEA